MRQKYNKNSIREFFTTRHGKYFLLFLELLLLLAFFAKPELYYYPEAPSWLDRFYADSLLICGIFWIGLVLLTLLPVSLKEETDWILTSAAGCLMPLVCFIILEAYNDLQFWGPVSLMEVRYVLLDLLIYYVIFAFLLLIFNSVRGASIALVLFTAAFGILNYELTVFRNMSFIASDIYSAGTALVVANTYEVQVDVETAELIILTLFLCALLLKLRRRPLFKRRGRLIYLGLCICLGFAFCNAYVFSSMLEKAGVDFRVYRPQFKYRYYGTLLTTARTFGYLHVREPEDYTIDAVEATMSGSGVLSEDRTGQENKTGKAGKKPNIICIMNESFSDPASLGDLSLSQDYMPYFRSLKENTIRGSTYSSVFGGNTANSEFEFLTGNSMAFLPDNSVPYQLFLRKDTPGLISTLKAQGYGKALALHPYYETGYSRYKIYPLMGFDHFYTSEDFSVFANTVNYHITDEEDYQKIIDLYQARDPADGPFLIFNVTMQNHGSYSGSTAETGDAVRLTGEYARFKKAEEFLNMMKMSDDALKGLVNYFKKVDEPTVILFFGDHMADLDDGFYDTLMGKPMDELEGEELEELYRIPFLIWANYDIEEREIERTSNNYLSTYLADAAGFQRTPYLSFLTDLREEIPAINALGYWDRDGNYYENDDRSSPYYDKIHQYHLIEYNNLFGGNDRKSNYFYLDRDHESGEEKSSESTIDY